MVTGLNPAVLPQGKEQGKSKNGSPFFFMVQIFGKLVTVCFITAVMLFMVSFVPLATSTPACHGNWKNTVLSRTRRRE